MQSALLLQLLSILPISMLHARLVVNYAYAASLRTVTNRSKLMISVFAASVFHMPRRLLRYLRASTTTSAS